MSRNYTTDDVHKLICPVCKQEWSTYPYDMSRYAYKYSNKVLCSYTCYMKLIKEKESMRKRKRRGE